MRHILAVALLVASVPAYAADPAAMAQYATFSGVGNQVAISRLPVVMPDGTIAFRDVTVTLKADAKGTVTITSTNIMSPSILVSGFLAGDYASNQEKDRNFAGRVDGPGIQAGGATSWSFTLDRTSGDKCAYPGGATWTTGSMPKRAADAGLTSHDYAYGTTGVVPCGVPDGWGNNTLIGVQQTGNAISFTSFTKGGKDQSTPNGTITFYKR